MEIKKIIESKKEITEDVICDCCGKSCMVSSVPIDNPKRLDDGEENKTFEFMKMEATWGFQSGKDTERWEAFICEVCVDTKFPFVEFKKSNYM